MFYIKSVFRLLTVRGSGTTKYNIPVYQQLVGAKEHSGKSPVFASVCRDFKRKDCLL